MHTCTKRYTDLPFAHRQHKHDGHCKYIHGHNWSFEFEFGAKQLESNGFVIDFGKLKWLKAWLDHMFDHTLLLNQDDPHLTTLQASLGPDAGEKAAGFPAWEGFADIRVVPNGGAEGLAKYIFDEVNSQLSIKTDGRVFLVRVTAYEDLRNSATYAP